MNNHPGFSSGSSWFPIQECFETQGDVSTAALSTHRSTGRPISASFNTPTCERWYWLWMEMSRMTVSTWEPLAAAALCPESPTTAAPSQPSQCSLSSLMPHCGSSSHLVQPLHPSCMESDLSQSFRHGSCSLKCKCTIALSSQASFEKKIALSISSYNAFIFVPFCIYLSHWYFILTTQKRKRKKK